MTCKRRCGGRLCRCLRQHADQPQSHLGSVKTFPESPRIEPGPSMWLSQRPGVTAVSQHAQLKAGGFGFSPPLSQSLRPPSYWAPFALYLICSLIPYPYSSLYPDSLGQSRLALKRLFPHCSWTTKNHSFNNNSRPLDYVPYINLLNTHNRSMNEHYYYRY